MTRSWAGVSLELRQRRSGLGHTSCKLQASRLLALEGFAPRLQTRSAKPEENWRGDICVICMLHAHFRLLPTQ